MDLKWFVYPGWRPRVRPAPASRGWMDNAPEAFPYRCLPLNIANGHGWEILSNCGFEAVWNGGMAPGDVTVRADEGSNPDEVPQALFGLGTFTIHTQGLIRTPPGWNLYVSGPPNVFKDGVAPLSGIIETDWSPYSFTMNWRLTRPNHPVRFEMNEPIAHFFPVRRGDVEQFQPSFAPIADDPELKERFEQWSRSRDAFQQRMKDEPPAKPSEKWQKLYYRGVTPDGICPVADHQSKLRVAPFARAELVGHRPEDFTAPAPSPTQALPPAAPIDPDRKDLRLAKYAWLLDAQERQRSLSAVASAIPRCQDLSAEHFLDLFYAPSRPVILSGEVREWPACKLWNPAYLRQKIGSTTVEFQGGRSASEQFERYKDAHTQRLPFDRFMDLIEQNPGNDAYVTAYNNGSNADLVALLKDDVGSLEKYLAPPADGDAGMLWIGPAGTFTALHHDLTNNLLVQVVGRKRVILASPANLAKIYNDRHVFSEIADVESPSVDFARYPMLADIPFFEVELGPGDCLFLPLGWWHQVRSLDFSVSITYTNFQWANDHFRTYPSEA